MSLSTTASHANTALDFLYACQEIGGIAESNGHYTAGLTRQIEQTGKAFEQLTIAELLTLHRDYNAQFNRLQAGE